MPSFAPRTDYVKKQHQLVQCRDQLKLALYRALSAEKITRAVKKYRDSQLSFYKAQLHYIKEMEFQNKHHSLNEEKIMKEMDYWLSLSEEQILAALK
jgi:hypothetical protein